MLSNITIMILAILTPVMSVFCFIKGYNIGAKETKKPEIKIEAPKEKKKRREISKEAEKRRSQMSILLENIEAYDGTSKGQKELR